MPTLNQLADQVYQRLDWVIFHTSNTSTQAGEILTVAREIRDGLDLANDRLTAIDEHNQTGFTNLSQGLALLSDLHRMTNALLDHHRQQNETIICELMNGNELLCGITRKLTRQLELSEQTLTATRRIEGILVRVHPSGAADYDREVTLHARLDECCPPPTAPSEPCPAQCEPPTFTPPPATAPPWTPLPTPEPLTPVG